MQRVTESDLERCVPVLLAFLYAYALAFIFPLDVFKDRIHYLDYASRPLEAVADYLSQGVGHFLFNEPVFLILNYLLSVFLSPGQVLQVLIFSFSFLFAFCVLQYDKRLLFWLLLALLLPQVLKNYVMQLRQGYAISIFMCGWLLFEGRKRWLVLAFAPLIHASFFIVFAFLAVHRVLCLLRVHYWLVPILMGVAAFLSTFVIVEVASLLGARQGERYAEAALSVSGSAFLFWSCVLFLFMSQGRIWLERFSVPAMFVAVYLGLYFTSPLAGRVFESVLPLVLLAGFSLKGQSFRVFCLLFLFYFSWHYYSVSDEFLFGFGAAVTEDGVR